MTIQDIANPSPDGSPDAGEGLLNAILADPDHRAALFASMDEAAASEGRWTSAEVIAILQARAAADASLSS